MRKLICSVLTAILGIIILVLTLNLWNKAFAQPQTQRTELEQLSRFFAQQLEARRPQIYYDLLKSEAFPQLQLNQNPDIQLIYINERGHPVFYTIENLNAAKTISTDDVWPGGSGGLSLNGSGTVLGELGVWDAGGVLMTHQEFGGRVTQMDSPSGTHYHSTHVAGTMVAAGVAPSAKGMSFQGTLAAYDWNNDDSEMASAAASGMKISNHSYSYIAGWRYDGDWYWWGDITISTTEDYGFGFYGSTAQAWDQIAYNAPYYTIVKSAGNDRDDYGPGPGGGHYVWIDTGWVWSTDTRDPDGGADGYDCIPWFATAKNIITVGAVFDIPGGYTSPGDVVISSFSGWGPTDDGRIKPNLVANGISLYSCIDASNSSYASYGGTSMSAPNLSGSLNLLIHHYEAIHGDSTPLSSTMKAVLTQTADEAGPSPGPDYMFGWGLMNTLSAAELIIADSQQNERIIEEPLTNSETDEYYLYSYGTEPIRVTLAWTDPPGTPPTPSLNPTTAMLVNDLDLRVEHVETSTIYQPYVLDPNNPDNPASTGDNFRDNIEQVYITSPAAGNYIVTVTHKGTLATTQYYSLVSSSKFNSRLNSPPNPFSLISPADLDSVKTPFVLDWEASIDPDPDDTVFYDVYLDWTTAYRRDVYTRVDDSLFIDTLDIGLWHWTVRAYDTWGVETWANDSLSFYVYICGDCNTDGEISVSDVIYSINYLFKGGFAPKPMVAADVSCDGDVTVSDVVYLINYLFKGGSPPCDPTDDGEPDC